MYLDTSVLVPLYIDEPFTPTIGSWIRASESAFIISDLAAAEFGSAISRLIRMDAVSIETAAAILAHFDRWRAEISDAVEIVAADIRVASKLVRRAEPKLLTPDAIHLAACLRLEATLVTFDDGLIEAAPLAGVSVLTPQ